MLCAALNVNLRNENVEVGVELTNTLVEIVHSYVQPVNSVAKFDLISSQNITNVSHSSLAVARKCVRCDVHKDFHFEPSTAAARADNDDCLLMANGDQRQNRWRRYRRRRRDRRLDRVTETEN